MKDSEKDNSRVNQGEIKINGGVSGSIFGDQKNETHYHSETSETNIPKEIEKILDNLSQEYPTNTATEKITLVEKAIETIEKKPKLKEKIIKSLQAGLIETLKQTLKHPAASIFIAVMKEWKK